MTTAATKNTGRKGRPRPAGNTRPARRVAVPPRAVSEWSCARCGRSSVEILAAHRLDAIRVALRVIGDSEVSRREIRPHLRKMASHLRVPYLPLLECVAEDIVAGDLSGLLTTRCTVLNADCAGRGAHGAAAIRSVRTQAGIEAIAALLDEVEDAYGWNALNPPNDLAEEMQLPNLVIEVLISRVVAGGVLLSDIDEFNAWRTAEPLATKLIEENA